MHFLTKNGIISQDTPKEEEKPVTKEEPEPIIKTEPETPTEPVKQTEKNDSDNPIIKSKKKSFELSVKFMYTLK